MRTCLASEDFCAPVSVVIPCYRCADTVVRAVESVARQTLLPAEVILVDDCGGDETLSVLRQLRSAYPDGWIKLIEHASNRGPGTARNTGWSRATGRYIAFLDADDSWHARKVEFQFGWMERNPSVVLSGHACVLLRDGLDRAPEPAMPDKPGFRLVRLPELMLLNRYATRSAMLRRDIEVRFAEDKRHSEDYLLWLQVTQRYGPGAVCDAGLAFLYKHEYGAGGLSADLWKMTRGELQTYARFVRGTAMRLLLPLLWTWCIGKHLRREVMCMLRRGRSLA